MAENEADDFVVPDVQHFLHAYIFFFLFFFFFRMPVYCKRMKKGRDLSSSPSTIPMSKKLGTLTRFNTLQYASCILYNAKIYNI